MRPLWTPWRMPYILGIKSTAGCVFCDEVLVEREGPSLIIHRGDRAFVILNLYPYATGHLMVVPYRHVASLHDLDQEETAEMTDLLGAAEKIAERELGVRVLHVGINVGRCAGAGVEGHIHIHLVPGAEPSDSASVGGDEPPEALELTRDRLARAWVAAHGGRGDHSGDS